MAAGDYKPRRGDEYRGVYLPRAYEYKSPGTIYGAAFAGCPVPSLERADGGPVEERPRGLIITDHTGRAVEWLASIGAKVSGSAIDTYHFTKKGMSTRPVSHFYVNSFMYPGKDRGRNKQKASLLVSTSEFTDAPIEDLFLSEPDNLALALAQLGADFVKWCEECGYPVKPGKGAAAAMFLRDERFKWGPRARIPDRLNEIAREQLPGNHYRLWRAGKFDTVVEYDQKSAHHNAAKDAEFPDSMSFGAMGRSGKRVIATVGTEAWSELTKRPGLFRVRVAVDHKALPERTYPMLEDIPDDRLTADIWVWSSELQYVLTEPGITPVGILSSYSSHTTNPGMNNFALWALSELERNAEDKRRLKWLKPFLLTAYGAVATRPKVGFFWSTQPSSNRRDGRQATQVKQHKVIGGRVLEVYVSGKPRKRKQADYVNVFIAGIIQALVRAKTIERARELEGDTSVLTVSEYADAIFVAMVEREESWKLFADSVGAEPKTSYAQQEGEISISAVRVTSRASRSPRVSSPLPAPTPLTGTVRLASGPRTQRKYDDGSNVWRALQPLLSGELSTGLTVELPLSDGWIAKRTLHNFETEVATHWTADEDSRSPGVRRKKSSD